MRIFFKKSTHYPAPLFYFMKHIILYAIAEAEFIFKQNIIENISRSPFYKLLYAANNGHELINSLRKHPLDIILVDLFMPVLSGIEAIKFIRLIDKNIPIICYAHTYQPDIAAMLKPLNTIVYCEKKVDIILSKLDIFFKTGLLNDKEYEEEWIKKTSENEISLFKNTSTNQFNLVELRLMKLTYEGFTNKEIAQNLNLSTRTIDTYVKRLTEKLGLRSKIDLIRYAVENGIYNTSL